MRSGVKISLAVAAFAAVHSLLASRSAKERAASRFGERNRNGLYRVFFNTQAIVTSTALVAYCARLPDRPTPFWRVPKGVGFGFNLVRLGLLFSMYSAARQVGIGRIGGWHNLVLWWRGAKDVPPEPEAQGPALDRPLQGPFRFTRHPLNLLSIPLIWLAPRITRNRFAFNMAATAYFLLGSVHEELRLRRAAPDAYRAYQREVRFLAGRTHRSRPHRQLTQ